MLSPIAEHAAVVAPLDQQEHGDQDQVNHDNKNFRQDENDDDIISGVLFSKSVRSRFASLHLAPRRPKSTIVPVQSDDDDCADEPFLVRLQFMDDIQSLRSYCRRFCKLGDLLAIRLSSRPASDLEIVTAASVSQGNNSVDNDHDKNKLDQSGYYQQTRFVVHISSTQQASHVVSIRKSQYWTMRMCQQWQNQYLPPPLCSGATTKRLPPQNQQQEPHNRQDISLFEIYNTEHMAENHHHAATTAQGRGLEKRRQGEYLANFLLHMIMNKLQNSGEYPNTVAGGSSSQNGAMCNNDPDPSQWATSHPFLRPEGDSAKRNHPLLVRHAISFLNAGSGVVDAAGGSGHVSMALGQLGIRSTVVDPRESVGKLPGRDRKYWNRLLLQRRHQRQRKGVSHLETDQVHQLAEQDTPQSPVDLINGPDEELDPSLYCQPVQYQSLRAWFGTPPVGVDNSFRQPDQIALTEQTIPICGVDHELLRSCSAIVALHPDEATDAIVEAAIQLQRPLVIVPCCVFFRLFPHRKKPKSSSSSHQDETVSTRLDLLDYLQAKHESIRRTQLPFVGANTVLWSVF